MRGLLVAILLVLVLSVSVQSGGILNKHKGRAGQRGMGKPMRLRKRGYMQKYRGNDKSIAQKLARERNKGRVRYLRKRHIDSRPYNPYFAYN